MRKALALVVTQAILAALFMIVSPATDAAAQGRPRILCYADATTNPTAARQFMQWDERGRRIVAVNRRTGVVEADIETGVRDVELLAYTKDCAYAFAVVDGDTVFWDTVTWQRYWTIPGKTIKSNSRYYPQLYTSITFADGYYVAPRLLVGKVDGYPTVWNIADRVEVPLPLERYSCFDPFYDVDLQGKVMFVRTHIDCGSGKSSGNTTVDAINFVTGARLEQYAYPATERKPWLQDWVAKGYHYWNTTLLAVSPDFSKLVIYGSGDYDEPAFFVIDRATGTYIELNAQTQPIGTITFSPDNRFLLMRYTLIRVWDLGRLQENPTERIPVYRLPREGGYTFVSPNVIRFTNYNRTRDFDLITGQYTPYVKS